MRIQKKNNGLYVAKLSLSDALLAQSQVSSLNSELDSVESILSPISGDISALSGNISSLQQSINSTSGNISVISDRTATNFKYLNNWSINQSINSTTQVQIATMTFNKSANKTLSLTAYVTFYSSNSGSSLAMPYYSVDTGTPNWKPMTSNGYNYSANIAGDPMTFRADNASLDVTSSAGTFNIRLGILTGSVVTVTIIQANMAVFEYVQT
jgi:hypothetical protein